MEKGKEHIATFIKEGSQTLTIRINGAIEFGWSASVLRDKIDEAIQTGVQSAHIYLNTPGGSVYEATEMVNELRRLPNVEITAGALVASAGTYIMAHFPVKAYANSQFMIHKPMTALQGNEDVVKSDLKALENLTNDYRSVYAKRFGKTEDEIEAMWKQDCWLNAQEAKELGLITEIINGEPTINAQVITMMQACGCPNIPEKTSKNPNTMNREQLISTLGMSADATDEQINERIASLKKQAEDNTQNQRKEAEALVNQAVKDKRITADSSDAYIKLAMADYEQTKKALETLPKAVAGSTYVKKTGNTVTDKSNWTLEDYLEKDPKAFEELMESDPEKARELNAKYQFNK